MVWGLSVALLLVATLGLGQQPRLEPGLLGLRHTYDCGMKGLQLLVFPPPGWTVRFKVVDEFGNTFEVNNCSICYHWVTAKPKGPVVFSADYKGCHVLEKVVGNRLIYENQLVSDMDVRRGPQGSITREGTFRLHMHCIFNASDFLPLQASIFPPPSPAAVTQSGPLRLELRIAKDVTYGSYYGEGDYPIVRLLREPVPVEVRLLQRTDPSLVLVLHQCWATPSANPVQQPQWPILWDGCPFDGDSYRTRLVALDGAELPFPSHYQRFTVATFVLLDSGSQRALRGPVYFFCSASACAPSGLETCATACSSRTARQRRSQSHRSDTAEPQNIVSSPGPVHFEGTHGQEPTLRPT
uniref:Zona pellucida glycoprotein 1 n=1 Tax=Equus caballus TaxID=9796 RepID=A0A9L0R4S3_HORSE